MIATSAGADDAAPGLLVTAALQDHLLIASHDLDQLQTLLAHACDTLMARFCSASEHAGALLAGQAGDGVAPQHEVVQALHQQLGAAVTALQFQDMASQLIAHTHRRLRCCADQLANQAFGADEDGDTVMQEEPHRPNPVAQAEMDAGAIELF